MRFIVKKKGILVKKILSIILPSIVILAIILWGVADKNILLGLYLLLPIVFIIQGRIYSDNKNIIIGFLLSSLAFIIPINLWFSMGNCIVCLISYNILGVVSYLVKKKLYFR